MVMVKGKLRILSLRAVLRRAVMCVGLLAPGYAFSGGATLNDYGSGISYQPTLAAPPGKVWAYEHATGQNILMEASPGEVEKGRDLSEMGLESACPEGQTYIGTVGGRCVPSRTASDPPPAGSTADQEAARRRAACIANVRQAASSCESAKQTASTSCDAGSNSQLEALNTEGQQINRDLQNSARQKAACDRNADYQRRLGAATSSFQASCQRSVQSCSGACQQVPSVAQGCSDDSQVRAAVNSAQSSASVCSTELQSRANQAAQQTSGQTNAANSSSLCSQDSASSEDAVASTASPNDQITAPNTPSGEAQLGTGASPDYMKGSYEGDGMLSATSPEGGSKFNTGSGQDELGKDGSTGFDNLAQLPTRQGYGYGGGGSDSGGGFSGTPGFNDSGDESSPVARAARKLASSEESAGGGGRKGTARRYSRIGRFGSQAEGDSSGLSTMAAASTDGSPDLRKFLPHMKQARRIAGMAALGIHPAETNFFSKVHDRYVALNHTFETDTPTVVRLIINAKKRKQITLLCVKPSRPDA